MCTTSACPAFDITAHSMFTHTGLLMQRDAFSVRHCVNKQYAWGLIKKKGRKKQRVLILLSDGIKYFSYLMTRQREA